MNKTFVYVTMLLLLGAGCGGSGEALHESENKTLESILNRTSIREYSGREVSDDTVETLLRAGMAAPSSRDRRPWLFVVLSDKELMKELGGKLRNASVLADASKAIVVCGDERISDNCWFLDCAAATQNILLAAESEGIGAVWTAVYPYADREEIVDKALQLPDSVRALAIVPLGYPVGKHKAKDKYDETRIFHNQYGSR